jgi:hypothetical protein
MTLVQMSKEFASFVDENDLMIEKDKDKIIVKVLVDGIEFQHQVHSKLQQELLSDIMNGRKSYQFDKLKKQLHIDYKANDRIFTDTIQLRTLLKENPPDKLEIYKIRKYKHTNNYIYVGASITSYRYTYLSDGRVNELKSSTWFCAGHAYTNGKNVDLVVSLFEDIKSGKNKNYTFKNNSNSYIYNGDSDLTLTIEINYNENNNSAIFSTNIINQQKSDDDCCIIL